MRWVFAGLCSVVGGVVRVGHAAQLVELAELVMHCSSESCELAMQCS